MLLPLLLCMCNMFVQLILSSCLTPVTWYTPSARGHISFTLGANGIQLGVLLYMYYVSVKLLVLITCLLSSCNAAHCCAGCKSTLGYCCSWSGCRCCTSPAANLA